MVNKIKRSVIILISFIFLTLSISSSIYASSISMGNSTTLEIGGTSIVTVSGSDVTGRFNISSSNSSVVSLSSGSIWVENNSVNVTATAKSAGIATITVTPDDVSDSVGTDITGIIGTKTITIKVNAPVVVAPAPTPVTPTVTTNNNANLKRLVPSVEGLTPNFNPAVTKYSLTVPSSITNLGLTISVDGAGAKYWVSGEKDLKLGDNTVSITVTASDGTKKVYTIIVTKADDIKKANAYLSSIVIDGRTLSPEFTAETLEYDIGTISSDIEKLTVLAYAQSENSKVEILGNDKFISGENIIKIKVIAADGVTSKEYHIKLTKEESKVIPKTNDVEIYSLKDVNDNNNISGAEQLFKNAFTYFKANGLVLMLFALCVTEFIQILWLYVALKRERGEKVFDFKDMFTKAKIKKEIDLADVTIRRRQQDITENPNLDMIDNNDKKEIEDTIEENMEENDTNNNE